MNRLPSLMPLGQHPGAHAFRLLLRHRQPARTVYPILRSAGDIETATHMSHGGPVVAAARADVDRMGYWSVPLALIWSGRSAAPPE